MLRAFVFDYAERQVWFWFIHGRAYRRFFFKWIIVYNIDLDFIKNKLLYKYPMHMVLGKEKDDDELLFLLMGSKILSYNLVKGTIREIEINFPSC